MSATHRHLLSLPECTGTVGAVGFCLGGTLSFLAAATSRVDGKGLDAAVSYYGSGNDGLLDQLDDVACPVLFHYGDRDPWIPQRARRAGRAGDRRAGRGCGSSGTTPATPSPTGTRRRCTTRRPPTAAWASTTAFLAEHLQLAQTPLDRQGRSRSART